MCSNNPPDFPNLFPSIWPTLKFFSFKCVQTTWQTNVFMSSSFLKTFHHLGKTTQFTKMNQHKYSVGNTSVFSPRWIWNKHLMGTLKQAKNFLKSNSWSNKSVRLRQKPHTTFKYSMRGTYDMTSCETINTLKNQPIRVEV